MTLAIDRGADLEITAGQRVVRKIEARQYFLVGHTPPSRSCHNPASSAV